MKNGNNEEHMCKQASIKVLLGLLYLCTNPRPKQICTKRKKAAHMHSFNILSLFMIFSLQVP